MARVGPRPEVSVLIPTRNAGPAFVDLLEALRAQTLPVHEILVIDSESSDGTADLARLHGASVWTVAPSKFDHGGTRNALAAAASGEVYAFLTQDAVPADASWLERLVDPIVRGEADASFARQLPRPNANPIEAFARAYNYPPTARRVTRRDVERLGVWAYFFSNASSAVHRDTFHRIGGLPTGQVMNEDLLFAVCLLDRGGAIAYVADAKVVHSHGYDLVETFRRYFDIGAVFAEATELRSVPRTASAGARYTRALMADLMQNSLPHWIPLALAESVAKGSGYALGRRVRRIPPRLRPRLSLHPDYWKRSAADRT